jgi:hypothetical protein
MLTAILYDHVAELTARVGAAHDATAGGCVKPNWPPLKAAKQSVGEMLSAAGAGEEFVITCHGWPVAKIGLARDCAAPT